MMRSSTSATTVATLTTIAPSIKRPMSTSIISSVSLDDRNSTRPISTPHPTPAPKRPSSTSQAALASSQSQVALNLLNRLSTSHSSIRPLDLCSPATLLIIRDFGFKSNDPRHFGQRIPTKNSTSHRNESRRSSHHQHQDSSFYNLCSSPMGPDSSNELEIIDSEHERAEAEEVIEIDKLMKRNQENLSISSSSSSASSKHSNAESNSHHLLSSNENIGMGEGLNKLASKYENLFVSLYDFIAEGESEMNLTKGEIVKVLEIICDGWVVARKIKLSIDDDGKLFNLENSLVQADDLNSFELPADDHQDDSPFLSTGLCPENYLLKIS